MGSNWSLMIAEADRTGMLIGTWVTSLTWGILSMQLLDYTRGWHRDSNILRGTVMFLFASETAVTVLTFVGAKHQLINTPRGSIESVQVRPAITSSSAGFLNGCTMAGVNLFLLWRFHRLTKKWWISAPLAICALASTACIFWSVQLGINTMDTVMAHPQDLAKIMTRVVLGLRIAYGLEVLVVTATLTALLAEFVSRMSEDLLTGRQLMKKLIIVNLGSGAVTVALALVAFVEAMRNANSNMLVYANCVSRSYFMSMLFNLAMRDADAFKPKTQSIGRVSTSLGTGSRAFTEGSYESRSLQKSSVHELVDDYQSMGPNHKVIKHERDSAFPSFESSQV